MWPNPDLLVHRFDSGLKSFQIKYKNEEHMERAFHQYRTKDFEDLSHVTFNIENFPPAKLVSEHDTEQNSVSERGTEPNFRQLSPSKDPHLICIKLLYILFHMHF